MCTQEELDVDVQGTWRWSCELQASLLLESLGIGGGSGGGEGLNSFLYTNKTIILMHRHSTNENAH